ncbi:hypothetical protein AMS68_001657 [Peltaster fructicola]|uniref:BRCT domain-containing protein n=1 Tax=Peltaster fructicola TaxID=286661 RepID=A0A6H0XNS8_9PEZI|nr:hypothetical protein AMS68_001657 [Peltaster fructicola]
MSVLRRMQQNGWVDGRPERKLVAAGTIDTYFLAKTDTVEEFCLVQRHNGEIIVIKKDDEELRDVRIAHFRQFLLHTPASIPLVETNQHKAAATRVMARVSIDADLASPTEIADVEAHSLNLRSIPGHRIDNQQDDDGEEVYSTARDSVTTSTGKTESTLTESAQDATVSTFETIGETPVKSKAKVESRKTTDAVPHNGGFGGQHDRRSQHGITQPDPQSPAPSSDTAIISSVSSARPKRKASITGTEFRGSTGLKKAIKTSTLALRRTERGHDAHQNILLSSSSQFRDDKRMVRWLRGQDITLLQDIPKENVDYTYVVGEADLQLSIKLLRTLVLGQTIVMDSWLESSRLDNRLLDPASFQHSQMISPTNRDRIFAHWTVMITPDVYQSFSSGWLAIASLLRDAGAYRVEHKASHKWHELSDTTNMLFVALNKSDMKGRQIADGTGAPVYHKDILTQSIFHGKLLTDSKEYRLDYGTAL